MKISGVSCETKFRLLVFLGHPTPHTSLRQIRWKNISASGWSGCNSLFRGSASWSRNLTTLAVRRPKQTKKVLSFSETELALLRSCIGGAASLLSLLHVQFCDMWILGKSDFQSLDYHGVMLKKSFHPISPQLAPCTKRCCSDYWQILSPLIQISIHWCSGKLPNQVKYTCVQFLRRCLALVNFDLHLFYMQWKGSRKNIDTD